MAVFNGFRPSKLNDVMPVVIEQGSGSYTEDIDNPFASPDHNTDIVLVSEDAKLHFSKTILSVCSPVFDRMFNSDFAEKTAQEIPLPGKKLRDMVEFLKQCHPVHAGMTPLNDEILHAVLTLAREYQVEHIFAKCQDYIGLKCELLGLYTWKRQASKSTAHRLDFQFAPRDNARNVELAEVDQLLLYTWLSEEFDLPDHRKVLVDMVAQIGINNMTGSKHFKKFSSSLLVEALCLRCKNHNG